MNATSTTPSHTDDIDKVGEPTTEGEVRTKKKKRSGKSK